MVNLVTYGEWFGDNESEVLDVFEYDPGRMPGGMPGGGVGGAMYRGWGCQRRASDRFQEGRVSSGCPGHPWVDIKIDIVSRGNKYISIIRF